MSEDVIADGLEAHRYLKAVKLVDQFETDVQELIGETLNTCVDENDDLFDEDVEPDAGEFKERYSSTLATIRTEYEMKPRDDDGNNLRLNIGLEWVDPAKQGKGDSVEGPLCYVLYKVQHGAADSYEEVRTTTERQNEWEEIRFGDEMWAYGKKQAPGIVYVPLQDEIQIGEALRTLQEHFSEYANVLTN